MNFHDVRFPAPLSAGSSGGPERRTEIVTLSNGYEERNSPWRHSRRRYDAGLGVRSLDDLAEVIAFFEARQGQLFAFRWKDWTDFKSCPPSKQPRPLDQVIGIGDGNQCEFQLVKNYSSGGVNYSRPITKPVALNVVAAVAGTELVQSTDFVVDYATGCLTFATAPKAGAKITAGFEFDIPVRFDTDRITASLSSMAAGEIPAIPIVEVRV
jgi:uncharacterized protein (TIGR02217 family)